MCYPERPDDVCLYDFVADYAKCGVNKDGKTKYRRLNKNVLPNHTLYDPNKENEKESYSTLTLLSLFAMKWTWWMRERIAEDK